MIFFLTLMLAFAGSFDEQLAEKIHYSNESNLVGYLYIGSDHRIDHTTYVRAKLSLEEYRKRGVIFVLCRLNTSGGDVLSSRRIGDLLKQMDMDHQIPVVSVIYNWALSSGAMIPYCCRFIVCTQNALMGAREPYPLPFSIPLKEEFARLAATYQRNPLIAEAMVDPNMILVKREGEIYSLKNPLEIQATDQVITAKGEWFTLDANQLIDLGVANSLMPVHAIRKVLNEELKIGQWPSVQSQLFHLPFFSQIPNATIINYQSWKINILSFLTHPVICALLLVGLVVSRRGFFAWAFFALIVIPNGMLGEIPIWAYALFGIGVALLFLRRKPLVILGRILLLIAIFGTLVPWPGHMATLEALEQLYFYLAALLAGLILVGLIALHKRKSAQAEPEPKPIPQLGAEGEAFTSLRPQGKVRIGYHLYEAIAGSGPVERGAPIAVKGQRDGLLLVDKRMK